MYSVIVTAYGNRSTKNPNYLIVACAINNYIIVKFKFTMLMDCFTLQLQLLYYIVPIKYY